MDYIAVSEFNGNAIDCGIRIEKGAILEEKDGFLFCLGKRICNVKSQVAFDHFFPNDGSAEERYELKGKILHQIHVLDAQGRKMKAEKELVEGEEDDTVYPLDEKMAKLKKDKSAKKILTDGQLFKFDYCTTDVANIRKALEILKGE